MMSAPAVPSVHDPPHKQPASPRPYPTPRPRSHQAHLPTAPAAARPSLPRLFLCGRCAAQRMTDLAVTLRGSWQTTLAHNEKAVSLALEGAASERLQEAEQLRREVEEKLQVRDGGTRGVGERGGWVGGVRGWGAWVGG